VRELTLAAFAAATGSHLVGEPRSARYAAFRDGFDERAERERLRAIGLRFLGRSEPGFPPLLAAIHDPPPGLYLRGGAEAELLSRPAAAVVGGIGSIPGAMAGGLLIGLAESFTAGYMNGTWKDAVTFSILVLVMLVRPTGLFGKPEIQKV